jgi:hypothetical protein
MNGEIYQISLGQFLVMMDSYPPEDTELIMKSAAMSTEIIVGMYDGRAVCFIGLAPRTLLSDTAYVWMLVTEFGRGHGILLARYGKAFVTTMLLKYPRIVGHCFEARSAKWLLSLGAVFLSEIEFEFRRGGWPIQH